MDMDTKLFVDSAEPAYLEDAQAEVKATDRFPCPQCAADMVFDPGSQALTCAYCGHRVDIDCEAGEAKEYDLAEGERLSSTDWGQATNVIHCQSCGARTMLETNSTADACSFCGSSHVVKVDELPGIRPESLIPFQVTADGARQSFAKWIGGRFFAPGDLKSAHQASRLRGMYIPFWTYDADTYSAYHAEKGTHYWVTVPVTVTRNGKTTVEHRQEMRTRWRPVSGTYAEFYNDELIHASERLDSVLAGTFGHYDLTKLVEYRPEYLSGFAAERYSIDLKQGWERAKQAIKQKISNGIVRQINGDAVRSLQFTSSFERVTFKHLLLPLWISSYTYKGKLYRFLVNGQTGEVHGEAPVSALKVTICVALGLAAAALVFYLLNNQ